MTDEALWVRISKMRLPTLIRRKRMVAAYHLQNSNSNTDTEREKQHMVSIAREFPSKYVKAADLNGRPKQMTMTYAEREKFGNGESGLALHFQDEEKALILNKTNATVIRDAYGDDTENWRGRKITLYSEKVSYAGKVMDGVRVRIPTEVELDDAIPF
jgi:hypothetical protein